MKIKQLKQALAVVVTACVLGMGIAGCGGGKDDPTSVALRPPKVQAPGAPASGGTTQPGNNGGSSTSPPGEGFGTITGRIVIDPADKENIPPLEVIKYAVGKAPVDTGFCASKVPIFDDSLKINPMNLGVQNVFLYLEKKPKGGKDKIESQSLWPTGDDGPEGKLLLDQINCTYVPHAMLVIAGQPFIANSKDEVVHSYKGDPLKSRPFNITIPSKGSKEVTVFTRPEKYPVSITCATHNWMQAYQLPIDHPYGSVTDPDGRFTISDLPSGEHEFVIWHEKGGKILEYPVTVNVGDNDLGDITIRLSQLSK